MRTSRLFLGVLVLAAPQAVVGQADPCAADLNDDAVVNVEDLLGLLSSFGSNTNGDINGDGTTNVEDLLLLLASFGGNCDTAGGGLSQGLVVYLNMDEESGNNVLDSSGNINHGTTSGDVADGRFCRGRAFVESGPQGINIPSPASHPTLEFGTGSFSVMGWAKFDDYTYPRTSFVAKNGHGCYFGDGREGWVPGWEIGHGFNPAGSDVCIRDSDNNRARSALQYNAGSRPVDLLGSWAHYAFVFDRTEHRVYCYINGVQQTHTLDISAVTGSVNNDNPFTIGTLYGWKTDGQLDEYRMYNRAVGSDHIAEIAALRPEMAANCPVVTPPRNLQACPAFADAGLSFNVNSYDMNSWTDGTSWVDVSGTANPAVGTIPGGVDAANHVFRADTLPAYHEFAGTEHFEFSNPAYFDFPGDFTVQVMVRLPDPMEGFAMLLSRRADSDYLQHHQIFIDRRQGSWTGCCPDGQPVAVMYMGGGGDAGSKFAVSGALTLGEWNQITFTVASGLICPYVNGVRSGDCATSPILDSNRQMGRGEPLEVGGEDSYSDHPLWSMASVMYYSRALSAGEVLANKRASNCIEVGLHPDASCPSSYIYDAGTSENPINCLTGEPGVVQVQLDRNHEYPPVPLPGCPLNPGTQLGETNHQGATSASNPSAGWIEAMPTADAHYFGNVISGDTGGFNGWGIEDDTSDGGQFHGYSRNLDAATNAQAFEQGWVITTRAKLVSGTQMSTYLLAYLGTNTFRYLPYIYFSAAGDIIVREYGQPEAVLPQADFDPQAYHLYELVYDPLLTDEAGCVSRGFAANCAAKLYVDGTAQGWYYPYRFPGTTASTAALQWGSGSSAGQAHLRYNLVHWSLLNDCSRKDYFGN